jgi:hypothetical protein
MRAWAACDIASPERDGRGEGVLVLSVAHDGIKLLLHALDRGGDLLELLAGNHLVIRPCISVLED